MTPLVPTVNVAQINVNSHNLTSFNDWMTSRRLKFCSLARGAFGGSRAWINFFSLSVNHFAVSGTVSCISTWYKICESLLCKKRALQSGSKNQMTPPKRTVAIPSVRNNLKRIQYISQQHLRRGFSTIAIRKAPQRQIQCQTHKPEDR